MAGKWDKRNNRDYSDTDDDELTMIRLHSYDLYDQELMELKNLVNEKKKFPKQSKAYDMAIEKVIANIHEEWNGEMPHATIQKDISEALKGGKYRKYYNDPTDDNIINLDRKKKSVKPKPKRKSKKKGCGCK